MTKNVTEGEDELRRLKGFNPFVVGLDDRQGVKRYNFQLFNGETSLITLPMREFDGYPLRIEYGLLMPTFLLVIFATSIPLLPFFSANMTWGLSGILVSVYLAFGGALYIAAAFQLKNLHMAYRAANSDILATNFVTKAHGIRSIVHAFKAIVYWRRYLRYLMEIGYICLFVTLEFWAIRVLAKPIGLAALDHRFVMSMSLVFAAAIFLLVFEVVRRKHTRGMDPTLALVLMIEEIGGQLLAFRQTKIVGADGN